MICNSILKKNKIKCHYQISMWKHFFPSKLSITTSLNLPQIYKSNDSKTTLTVLRTTVYVVVPFHNLCTIKSYVGQSPIVNTECIYFIVSDH